MFWLVNVPKMRNDFLKLFFLSLCLLPFVGHAGLIEEIQSGDTNAKGQRVYKDVPYIQEFSIKYYFSKDQKPLLRNSISANRDGQISILTNSGLLVPDNANLMYAGTFTPDIAYTPMLKKKIVAIGTYRNQTVYLDDKQLFSNAWAGKFQIEHGLSKASLFAGGNDFHFLVSDGEVIHYFDQNGNKLWSGTFNGLIQIIYQNKKDRFLLVSPNQIAEFVPGQGITKLYSGKGTNCAEVSGKNEQVLIGTSSGYLLLSENSLIIKVPCPDITCMKEIGDQLWLGSSHGAYYLNPTGKYCYYAGERWLPGDSICSIEAGPDNSVLVLTNKGLGQINRKLMTLEEKALFYEKQVREKNIRYGFNCSSVGLTNSYASGVTGSQPSDNLWTSMYLASQLFRYKVTGSADARENAYEAFEAMERLHTITGIQGLFARSFERDYKVENTKAPGWQQRELLSGSPASLWLPGNDHSNWTWRSTASSDQAIGQLFAMTMVLELSDDDAWKARALKCLDDMMTYIVKNNLYIIDVDGEPTMWGKWNPEYVNKFPKNVGDRKITSSNIIAMLQTAYHFTGKDIYKNKINELITKYGYLENLIIPFAQIGPADNDEMSKVLSEEWNHSDDEMYFLAYWGLYNFALTPELKEKFRESIQDHWNIERPEKNGLWNFIYAMTGAKDFVHYVATLMLRHHGTDPTTLVAQPYQHGHGFPANV